MTTPWEPEVLSHQPEDQPSSSQAVWDPGAGVFRTVQTPMVAAPPQPPPGTEWYPPPPGTFPPGQPRYANGVQSVPNGPPPSSPPMPTAGRTYDPRGPWDPAMGAPQTTQAPAVPPAQPPDPSVYGQPTYANGVQSVPNGSPPPPPPMAAAPGAPAYDPRGPWDPAPEAFPPTAPPAQPPDPSVYGQPTYVGGIQPVPNGSPPLPPPMAAAPGAQAYGPRGPWDPAPEAFQTAPTPAPTPPVVWSEPVPTPPGRWPDPSAPSPDAYSSGQPGYTNGNGAQPAPLMVPPPPNGVAAALGGGQSYSPQPPRDPTTGSFPSAPMASAPAAPPREQWEYVDPSSYSNPYTDQPVYTSGPQAPPTVAPPVAPQPPGYPATGIAQQPMGPDAQGVAAPPEDDPLLASNYEPEKGELKIKERRSWKTWQLVAAVLVAAVLGMWFNGNSGSASGTSASSGGGGYKLPPPSGSTATTTAGSSSARSGSTTATTAAPGAGSSAAAASTTTTAAGSSGSTGTTTPVAVGPATVLVPQVQQAGNWTSPAFTIAGGTWNVGWAFQCTPPPSATPTFEIFVVNNGAAPGSTPAVTSSAASGSAVTPLTSTGSQQVIVQTSAACRWAVKVTGSSS